MKDFWYPLQKIIEDVCIKFDSKWRRRIRVIDTHFLVLFIFKLVLSKNKQGYKSLLTELWERQELSKYQVKAVSSSSLCEARQKLSEDIFIELNKAVLLERANEMPLETWRGHRVFAADGSKIHLPHELLLVGYKASSNKDQYYPQGLMSVIYHLGSGLIYDCLLSSDKGERQCLISQMDKLSQSDVLVLDRGYFSYLLLYKAMEKNIHLICRLQSGSVNKEIKVFWDSPLNETVIDYCPSDSTVSQINKKGYELSSKTFKLRLIKYKIDNETYVCATTLIDNKQYPINEFAGIYHGRWGIEELFKISKEFIDVEDIHSKSEKGVKQELYAHALLINIARIFESEANHKMPPSSEAKNQKNPPTDIGGEKKSDIKEGYWQYFCGKIQEYKVNFKNCILVVSRHIEELIISISQKKQSWLSEILKAITSIRQKIRPGRQYFRRSRKPQNKWRSSNNVPKIALLRT